MKRAIFTLALALSAVAIGCGGGESDEDQVRGTIEDFAAANVDEDWSAACKQLTDDAQKALADAGQLFGGKGCTGTLEKAVSQLSPADRKKEFEDLKITNVKVDGDKATVKVNGETTRVVKQGEAWLLDFNPTGG